MKAMEEGTNKGGILADDMGLGKTITSLALILSRPSADNLRKVFLILVVQINVLTISRQLLLWVP